MQKKTFWRKLKQTASASLLLCSLGYGAPEYLVLGIGGVYGGVKAINWAAAADDKAGNFLVESMPGQGGGAGRVPAARMP
jgi:hypothetical protein